jgi:hypothetical protein
MLKPGRLRGNVVIRTGSLLILLSAVLPNTLYVGHGPLSFDHGHAAEGAHDGASEADGEHAQHCHVGPSRCGGSQSMVGAWWVGEDSGLLSLDGPARAVPHSDSLRATDALPVRILQPPKKG